MSLRPPLAERFWRPQPDRRDLKRRLAAPVFAIFIAAAFLSPRLSEETPLAIVNVNVIDATGARPRPNSSVVIRGGRIDALGENEAVAIPDNATIYDGTGEFLIPGLWDMHVHVLQEEKLTRFLEAFAASGVLGVRDMGSPLLQLRKLEQLRQQIARGRLAASK